MSYEVVVVTDYDKEDGYLTGQTDMRIVDQYYVRVDGHMRSIASVWPIDQLERVKDALRLRARARENYDNSLTLFYAIPRPPR